MEPEVVERLPALASVRRLPIFNFEFEMLGCVDDCCWIDRLAIPL
ncbi:hypothetical protein [Rhizobium laguerreae]|nr:hypothetical protein [Rhizobium laguerreae]